MAPTETDFDGFWGKPTATIDWCEANYEVTHYIAEFWNTVSNLMMIIPPLLGAVIAHRDKLEPRFLYTNLSLMVVGVGSWGFHGTLLYEMQLMDELPMIWGSGFLLYALMEVDSKPKSQNRPLAYGLIAYCAAVTIIYVTINKPIFHEVAYALMVLAMTKASIKICRHLDHSKLLFFCGLGSYALGFLIWNIDNIFCKQIRSVRAEMPVALYPFKPFLQGHAWWHLLAGGGTYFTILFITHARARFLKQQVSMEVTCVMVPCIRVTHK